MANRWAPLNGSTLRDLVNEKRRASHLPCNHKRNYCLTMTNLNVHQCSTSSSSCLATTCFAFSLRASIVTDVVTDNCNWMSEVKSHSCQAARKFREKSLLSLTLNNARVSSYSNCWCSPAHVFHIVSVIAFVLFNPDVGLLGGAMTL